MSQSPGRPSASTLPSVAEESSRCRRRSGGCTARRERRRRHFPGSSGSSVAVSHGRPVHSSSRRVASGRKLPVGVASCAPLRTALHYTALSTGPHCTFFFFHCHRPVADQRSAAQRRFEPVSFGRQLSQPSSHSHGDSTPCGWRWPLNPWKQSALARAAVWSINLGSSWSLVLFLSFFSAFRSARETRRD
jgi:hypothetical protein